MDEVVSNTMKKLALVDCSLEELRAEKLVILCELARHTRSELKLTQFEFAQKLRVSLTSIQNWESGRAAPRPLQVKKFRLLLEPP